MPVMMEPSGKNQVAQPLVIRANVGDTVQIHFENKPGRRASIHVQGLSCNVRTSDGADAGRNPDSATCRPTQNTWGGHSKLFTNWKKIVSAPFIISLYF